MIEGYWRHLITKCCQFLNESSELMRSVKPSSVILLNQKLKWIGIENFGGGLASMAPSMIVFISTFHSSVQWIQSFSII